MDLFPGIRARILCALFVLLTSVTAFAAFRADDLTVSENFSNPIGFYDKTPTFSWKLPGYTQSQSAYRIVVASSKKLLPDNADLWDTGKVTSSQSIQINYSGKELKSRQKVYWQIRFWDNNGKQSKWSKTASFELGLLNNSDWKAKWITLPTDESNFSQKAKTAIKIKKAFYGVIDDSDKRIDLTDKIADMVSQGKYIVSITNDFAGGDPAYGVKKTSVIECTVDGQKKSYTVGEDKKIDLFTGVVPINEKHIPQYLRKDFTLDNKVASARLYITSKGIFEPFINGKKVSGDYMAPGWTPYHTRIETITYDVTKYLKKGENTIGAVIGSGWYGGDIMTRARTLYPELLVQLEISYKDGSTDLLVTDSSWKATRNGPIRYASNYHGQDYDANFEMANWAKPGFDDSSWKKTESAEIDAEIALTPKRHYTSQEVLKVKVQSVTEPEPGRFVFDLGQNMVGFPILNIPVKAGQTIEMRYAEMLEQDGRMYTANYRRARARDYYTSAKDGKITYAPTMTFHGFRYVELSGFEQGVKPKKNWVTGCVVHSGFDKIGDFSSSHAKLNKLQSNIQWGQRGNFLDIPTDCPQRDERLGWTGDAQVFCPTSLFNFDVHSFWASWAQSLREDQRPDGTIPDFVPITPEWTGSNFTSPGWGDVVVVVPWTVYTRTGDKNILIENYDAMKKWVEFYNGRAENYLVKHHGYGDWLQPYSHHGSNGDTDKDLIATAYFGRCAKIMLATAKVLGKTSDVDYYKNMHDGIRNAYSSKYFDNNGKVNTEYNTQTAYLMGLDFGLFTADKTPGAIDNLLSLIDEAEGHLRTGFLGTPLINPVLDKLGYSDISFSILFKETYPSWFYSINQGATTMWERWNSYTIENGFESVGMNSFNHYAYGAIGQWMYERIAGLTPDDSNPGYKHFFIQPLTDGPLDSAQAVIETPYGQAQSKWQLDGKELQLFVEVPANTSATVKLRADGKPVIKTKTAIDQNIVDGMVVFDLMPGKHKFTCTGVK